jgi:hypothetical protein
MFTGPIIHAHHSEGLARHAEKEIVSPSKKCLTCSALSHLQHQNYLVSVDHPLLAPIQTYIILLLGVFAGVYKFTLQGFTNKGPPSFNF